MPDTAQEQKRTPGVAVKFSLLAVLLIGSLLPAAAQFPYVTAAAALLAAPIIWTVVKGLPILHRSACLTILVAAAIGAAAYFHAPITTYGAEKVNTFLTLTVFTATAAVLIRDPRDMRAWAKTWVAAGCLLACLALAGGVDAAGRAVGSDTANPIWLARAIGSPIVALLWLTYRKHVSRKAAMMVGLLLAAGLLATGSRGPTVAVCAAALVVITLHATKTRMARLVATVTAAATGCYVALALQVIPRTSRIGAFLTDPSAGADNSDRFTLAVPTIDVIAQHPAGVGFGNWRSHVPVLAHNYPHNLWLEVTCEAGWLVGALLVTVTARVAYRLHRATRTCEAAALALALLTFEVVSVSVSGDLNARTFWFTLTLGYAVSYWTWSATTPRTRTLSPPPSTPATLTGVR